MSSSEKPYISVVVPVYNEQESIRPLHSRIMDACRNLSSGYEVVYVDDGSSDTTFIVLEALHAADPRTKVVRFRKNCGQTHAMAAGFRVARGEIIVSMDGDLQNDPADIPRLIEVIENGYDVVCGWRKKRKDKLISRRIPSIIANWIIGKITGVPIHDNGCSLKAYRSQVIKRVSLYSEMHRFIPAMSTLVDAKIAEIEVKHHARQFGKSKYGISRAWRVFTDLFLIKMITGFATKPGLWFSLLSVPPIMLGVGCIAFPLFMPATFLNLSTAGLLLFSLGGHLIVMGVLGEIALGTGDYRPDVGIGRRVVRLS